MTYRLLSATMENMMRMKDELNAERCYLKKRNKKNLIVFIYPVVILLLLIFLPGAYYEKNIYYQLEDLELELGEPIPKEVYQHLKLLTDDNYKLETNVPLDKLGNTQKMGVFKYYLVYDDKINKSSYLTNTEAHVIVKDTTKPVIISKDKLRFKYGSKILARDIAKCYDLSKCHLEIKEKIDTTKSGDKNITILARDEANNKSSLKVKIIIDKKYDNNFYYSKDIEMMNRHNNQKNSLLTNQEKMDLRRNLVNFAKQFIGNPYVSGGLSLTNGIDCSGFTMKVYNNFDYLLPRIATSQIYMGKSVSVNELLEGDIIVYHYGHVGIYAGNNMMIHAGTYKTGIVMVPIFNGVKSYRRIIY